MTYPEAVDKCKALRDRDSADGRGRLAVVRNQNDNDELTSLLQHAFGYKLKVRDRDRDRDRDSNIIRQITDIPTTRNIETVLDDETLFANENRDTTWTSEGTMIGQKLTVTLPTTIRSIITGVLTLSPSIESRWVWYRRF